MTSRLPDDMPFVYLDEGPVPDHVRDDAVDLIRRLARKTRRPVLFARVKVRVDPDRDPDQEAVVQGTIDVSGSMIRAQVAAPNPGDGLNLLYDRLDRRLRRLAESRQADTKRPPRTPTGEWRSGDLPTSRPGYFPRPVEERQVVRRKSYAPGERISVDEALFDLDVLDYRFFLFIDSADDEVSLVYEEDGRVMLRKLSGDSPPAEDLSLGVVPNPTPAPELGADEAEELLDTTNADFVFFRDTETGEGCVLYRRYDGHYGMVVPG